MIGRDIGGLLRLELANRPVDGDGIVALEPIDDRPAGPVDPATVDHDPARIVAAGHVTWPVPSSSCDFWSSSA